MMKKPLSPLGSFVARDTPVARIDARVKIVLLLALTVAVFATGASPVFALWAVLLAAAVRLARMDVAAHLRALKPVAFILAFTLLANAVALDGHGDIALWGGFGLDTAGALRGFLAIARIALLLGFSLVVSASSTPPQLADACVSLLAPLGRLGVPVSDVGLMLSLALRFIPIVSEEFFRVQLAQRSRGVDFSGGSILHRIRAWASVLTPLVVSLFRRADRLGESMCARCYAEGGQISVEMPPVPARDRLVLVCGLAVCVLIPTLAWLL